jgi:hypothetical protein
VARPLGGGVGFIEVDVLRGWHGGYLIISTSSASWVAEVAWRECIKLCCGDASQCCWVAGHRFVGVVGSVSWLLVHCSLLPGGLRTASRMSWMLCWMTESCIVISSIVVEEVTVSSEGGTVVAMVSSILFVRASTAAFRAAVSSLDAR